MPPSPGDFRPAATAALAQWTAVQQIDIRLKQNEVDLIDASLSALGSGPRVGSAVEIICGTTGTPLWVCSGSICGISNRVMASPPPPGERSTRWVCLRDGDGGGLNYRDAVYFWNPEANASMVGQWSIESIEAKPETLRTAGGTNDGLRFRLVHPWERNRVGPIADGAPVALENMRSLADPVCFLRPVIQNGSCFLERRVWDPDYPELHVFYLRVVPEVQGGFNQPRPLTSSSTIRLQERDSGQVVWVNPIDTDWFKNRLMVNSTSQGGGAGMESVGGVPTLNPELVDTSLPADLIAPGGTFSDRFRIMSSESPDTPLVYGAVVGLHSLELTSFGNVETHSGTTAIYTQQIGGPFIEYAKIRASNLDNNHLFRLRPASPSDDRNPIWNGSYVMLESLADGIADGKRFLKLYTQGGKCWLERQQTGNLFIIEVTDAPPPQPMERLTTARAEGTSVLATLRKKLATSSASGRTEASMRFDGNRRLAVPGSAALARLTPPSVLTVEVRFYLDQVVGPSACILSKGPSNARDYHIWVTRDNRVSFSVTLPGGSTIELKTPPETITRQCWQLVSCVVDVPRMQVTLCVDGQVRASQQLAMQRTIGGRSVTVPVAGLRSGTAAPLLFGRGPDQEGAQPGLYGYLDEVRVFNGARKPAEILELLYCYALGREPGLVGCWRLGEQRQDKVPDITFNENDAVIGQ